MTDLSQIAVLTLGQVADMFGVCTKTIERWIREDNFPACRWRGHYRFSPADILRWQEEHRVIVEQPVRRRSKKKVFELVEG